MFNVARREDQGPPLRLKNTPQYSYLEALSPVCLSVILSPIYPSLVFTRLSTGGFSAAVCGGGCADYVKEGTVKASLVGEAALHRNVKHGEVLLVYEQVFGIFHTQGIYQPAEVKARQSRNAV